MTGTSETSVRRSPGRPRDPEKREQVLQAATELLQEETWPITVRHLVERSGVARAAIYRRWPSLDAVLADALDHGRHPIRVRKDLDLYDALVETYAGTDNHASDTERMIRRRIHLNILDPDLQQQYWRSHVHRRRTPVAELLRQGIKDGILRADLDVEATLDLLSGVAYYQFVARGITLEGPAVTARLRAAVDIVWQGMVRRPGPGEG
ncbi:TetR/AcrR family transcriptional regulator [Corynebacterium sp. YIM 101645]|uniref:TetR/AcrR family transcriptional regulator n=1 Tax=Corynebacterium lemuris TaxID=1859292 RepID=A0ABT2FSI0_9CORY|nr:TetR/AcrR family transcriptional regulator [Corynebacterium lemuris]MCS5478161.1 TetR/AcrR family transcriptional regulator [Corynebacterium lemuris]